MLWGSLSRAKPREPPVGRVLPGVRVSKSEQFPFAIGDLVRGGWPWHAAEEPMRPGCLAQLALHVHSVRQRPQVVGIVFCQPCQLARYCEKVYEGKMPFQSGQVCTTKWVKKIGMPHRSSKARLSAAAVDRRNRVSRSRHWTSGKLPPNHRYSQAELALRLRG